MGPSADLPLVKSIANAIAYWEADPAYKQVLAFHVKNDEVTFAAWYALPGGKPAGELVTKPFAPDRWHDFVLHVKWSSDPSVGFVEIWYDGQHVLNRTSVQTMYRDNTRSYPNFFHIGLLHGNFDTMPQAVFVDRVLDGTKLEDVLLLPSDDAGTHRKR